MYRTLTVAIFLFFSTALLAQNEVDERALFERRLAKKANYNQVNIQFDIKNKDLTKIGALKDHFKRYREKVTAVSIDENEWKMNVYHNGKLLDQEIKDIVLYSGLELRYTITYIEEEQPNN